MAAIAYPDQLDGRRRREVVKDAPPSLITQNSWKGLNILAVDMREGDAEHAVAPVLKLIDFGRGREEDLEADPYREEFKGLSENLAGVGWVLQDLVDCPNQRDLYRANDYRLWRAGRSAVFDPYDFTTGAHVLVLTNERLDRALRDLIAMCLSGHRHHLPILIELLTLARAGRRKTAEDLRPLYAKKKKDDAPAQGQGQGQDQGDNTEEEEWLCETDEAIDGLLQRLVFDADFDPERLSDMLTLEDVGVAVTVKFLENLTIDQ